MSSFLIGLLLAFTSASKLKHFRTKAGFEFIVIASKCMFKFWSWNFVLLYFPIKYKDILVLIFQRPIWTPHLKYEGGFRLYEDWTRQVYDVNSNLSNSGQIFLE